MARSPGAPYDEPECEGVEETAEAEPFEDPRALGALRREVFELVGFEHGCGVLYGMGFLEGMLDGALVDRRFAGFGSPSPQLAGTPLPLLFRPESGDLRERFRGSLMHGLEAALQRALQAPPPEPSCVVSAGYAAGWYSAILGTPILVRETRCAACGPDSGPDCHFEARPVEDWRESDPAWLNRTLPFADFDAARARAAAEAELAEPAQAEGSLLGAFDPLSPAIHVWGAVIVIPYSGAADCEEALEVISKDIGEGVLEVAILDLARARIEGIEELGLVRLLHAIEARGLCAVVAGAEPGLVPRLRSERLGLLPLFSPDLAHAIPLAFQLCRSTRGSH